MVSNRVININYTYEVGVKLSFHNIPDDITDEDVLEYVRVASQYDEAFMYSEDWGDYIDEVLEESDDEEEIIIWKRYKVLDTLIRDTNNYNVVHRDFTIDKE